MNRVPANQSVSFTTYLHAITSAVQVPHAFISAHLDRISNAFDMGETVAEITEELKMRWQITRGKWHKTPRQLAARVVR